MKFHQDKITLKTTGKSLERITSQVAEIVKESEIYTGLCSIFIRHTSASLLIQENADPDVLEDLNDFFAKLVPEDQQAYRHGSEGLDDMPAHIRSALTHTSEQIPVSNGRLVLGTWQGIYVWEHRSSPHQREIIIHVQGT